MKKIKNKGYGVSDEFGYNHAEASSFAPGAVIVGTEGDDALTGTSGDDTISGLGGNDVINGGSGDDKLMGGKGDDYYEAVDAGDVIVEAAGEGIDSVRTRINYTLGDNIEKLYLGGSSAINGSGNDLDNTIVGNAAANVLKGGKGNDTLIGQGGGDTLVGGTGNDTYYVYGMNDTVIEDAKEGTDTVISRAFQTTLSANVENLELRGSDAIEGIGNKLNNFLKGNHRDNVLSGGAGNDVLDGGNGTDRLIGGTGNDTYYVNTKTDVVVEFAGEGHDRVIATSSYRLGANIEDLSIQGTHRALHAVGNELDNSLVGNASGSVLEGKDGNDRLLGLTMRDGDVADTLIGGRGDDFYYTSAEHRVIEKSGEGIDTVFSTSESYTLGDNVENLILGPSSVEEELGEVPALNGTGNDLDNVIIGNGAANILSGGGGNDTLINYDVNDSEQGPGAGDTLIGGAGADTFVFAGSSEISIGFGFDTVMDFSLQSNDKLDISQLLSGFDPLQDALGDFVKIVETNGGTMLSVDMDGKGVNHTSAQVAFLHDVTGLPDLDSLVASGNLIVHH